MTAIQAVGERYRLATIWMFSILLLSYVINAMDRQLFSVLASDVRTALNLDVPQIGLASTIFTLGMGVAGIPTGYMMQRMSRRAVTSIGLFIFSAATCLTAYAKGLPDLLVYRFVSGLGEAMQLTGLLAIATTYFHRHRAVAASSINFTYGIGALIGPNIGVAILAVSNWQLPFIVFGLAGLPALMLIYIFVRPWLTEAQPQSEAHPDTREDEAASENLLSAGPLLLAAATMLTGLAIYGYLGLYPTYLREVLGFSPREAAFAVSFYGVGALFSLLGGWLGDRFDYHRVLFSALAASALIGGVLFADLSRSLLVHVVFSCLFGAAISGMAFANLAAGLIKSVSDRKASQASGLFVASFYVPAAFAGYVLGVLREFAGWSNAGLIQISGSAILAGILSLTASRALARKERRRI